MFQVLFLFQPLNILFNCYFSFLTLHYSMHVRIVLAFSQFTLPSVLVFLYCAFLSHFCVFLTELLYPLCPSRRKWALRKLLPSLLKKVKWTIIQYFLFLKARQGDEAKFMQLIWEAISIRSTLGGEGLYCWSLSLKPVCRIWVLFIEGTGCVFVLQGSTNC